MFLKLNQELSKHGYVAWVGAGSIADQFNEFEHWLPNFGIGYRCQPFGFFSNNNNLKEKVFE